MKFFIYILRIAQAIIAVCTLLLTIHFFLKDDTKSEAKYPISGTPSIKTLSTDDLPQTFVSEKKITVYDQGLHIPQGTFMVPEGWFLLQNIATNDYTGSFDKYSLTFLGPEGALIHHFISKSDSRVYGNMKTKLIEQQIQCIPQENLEGLLENVTIDQPIHSIDTTQPEISTDNIPSFIEVHFTGSRNGKAYKGVMQITNIIPTYFGTFGHTSFITMSPTSQLPETLQLAERLRSHFEMNPAYIQKVLQIQEKYRQWNDPTYQPEYSESDYYKNLQEPMDSIWTNVNENNQY